MGRSHAPYPCRPHHGHPPQNQRIPLLCATDCESTPPTQGATKFCGMCVARPPGSRPDRLITNPSVALCARYGATLAAQDVGFARPSAALTPCVHRFQARKKWTHPHERSPVQRPTGTLPARRTRRRRRASGGGVISTAFDSPQFRVKKVGQTDSMARHNTQNRQKCCDDRSQFKGTVHKGYNFPCSMTIPRIARRRVRSSGIGDFGFRKDGV